METDPGLVVDSGVYVRLGLIVEGKRLHKPPPLLSRLASSLERCMLLHQQHSSAVTVFDGRSPPEIAIADYLNRSFTYSRCSPSCFVIAYIYILHFLDLTRAHLTPLNVHRLLITSVMLAAKVFDDRYYNNAYYARVGGVSTTELNRLEMNLLFALDFKLHVDPPTFHSYCCLLEKHNSDGLPLKDACRLNKDSWRQSPLKPLHADQEGIHL